MKDNSIKAKLRRFILAIVLFLVIFGCSIALVLLVGILKVEKTEQIESVRSSFHEKVIMQTREHVEDQSIALQNLFATEQIANIQGDSIKKKAKDIFPNVEFAIYDIDKNLITKTELDITAVFPESKKMDVNQVKYLGNTNEGIILAKLSSIVNQHNKLLGYLMVYEKITSKKYVQYLKSEYQVDATIFYKDTRMVTTITEGGEAIVGTRLSSSVYQELLSPNSTYSGFAIIEGSLYISGYVSFGNMDEPPIGILFVGESLAQYSTRGIYILIAIFIMGTVLFFGARRLAEKWLTRYILVPLATTTTIMTEIADGDSERLINIDRVDYFYEFRHLLSAIGNMLEKVEESKKIAERIAYYDKLTGLPNRYNLLKVKTPARDRAQKVTSLILFDVDDFSTVNSLYGLVVGDSLISEISTYLTHSLYGDIKYKAYRNTGASFILLLEDVKDKAQIQNFAKQIMDRFTSPFVARGISLKVTVSAGISLADDMGVYEDTIEQMLYHAELAMLKVKHAFKNDMIFYSPKMMDEISQLKALEEDLKEALENDEFELHYQPKYNLKSQAYDSFEALIRWNSKKRGFVSPGEFIDVAEKSGLIVPMGNWVLKKACQSIKELSDETGIPYKIAVNISPIQINQDDFFDTIFETLVSCQLDPSQLELEVTENLLMTSFSTAVEKLRQLYVLGVSISVDDFGKGYSSLAYLQELPIHTLKIDKMFIDGLRDNANTMVKDIINLGHNIKLNIVAEGVENKYQRDYLERVGCDSIQGYYYSKPLPMNELKVFLLEGASL